MIKLNNSKNYNTSDLSYDELATLLSKERLEQVLYFDSIDSTNNKLRELAKNGAPAGTVVLANHQSAGRGRRGRNFSSPKDAGIYLSILMRPNCTPQECTSLTPWTAVAITRAIFHLINIAPSIKWVNDLYMNNKKICGILTELSMDNENKKVSHVVIGVGVNVNESSIDFPLDLRDIATSIYAETNQKINRSKLAFAIIKELDHMIANWPEAKDEYLNAYREYNLTTKSQISIVSGDTLIPVTPLNINDDFSLQVRHQDGKLENLSSGEVSIRL